MKPEEHYQRLKLVAKEMCNYLQSVFSNIKLATPPRVVSNNVVFTFETNIPDYDLFKWNKFTNDVETLLKDKFSATDYTTNVSLRDLSGRSNMAWKTCITGFIVTLTSTVKYEFENPLKSLSFRWGSSVKKTERVKDVTDVQSVMDKFVSMMNEKIAWALQQPGRRLPVKGYILVNYKQELDDNSYFTPVLVWECREDKIYAAAVDAVGYEYETKTNKFRKIGTSLDLNLLDGSNLYDFNSHQFNLEYQGDVMNTEYVTESIYNQMNKIDDNKSLDEKLKESFYDEDDYANDYEYEEWNWDGLKDDIDVNMRDVRLNGKKPFEYDTEVIDDDHIHIIIYIENDDGKTLTRYEADLVDMYSVPEYSSGVVDYIENLPWKQTGIESIDDNESLNEKYNVRTLKDVKKVTEAAKTEKVERPKGYRGSVGGYYSVDRYGYHFSKQPKGGGVMISEANVDWIRNTFELKECPELEYQTLWGRGVVYKLERVKEKKDALKESVEDSFDIDKYYTRGTDKDAIAYLDDPDLAEYLYKCETVDSSFKHVCWLMAKPEYKDALEQYDLVELVEDATGEFIAIFVDDRVYDVTDEIISCLS